MGFWDFLLYTTPTSMLLVAVAYMAVSSYLAHAMSKVASVAVDANPGQYGMYYEDVNFPARDDGLSLRGWLVPGRLDYPHVVIVHGAGQHRADATVATLGLTRALSENGYSVLLFDLRGHGESDQARMSAGYYERRDVLGAVDFLASRGVAPQKIAFLGFSLGAVAALLAAGDAGVCSVIADSAFSDLREVIRQRSRSSRSLAMLLPGMLLMSRVLFGIRMRGVRPYQVVENLDFPVLFIHGEEDSSIPVAHATRLATAAKHAETRLWVVPGVQHARAFVKYPHEYVRRVVQYLSQTVGPVVDEVEEFVSPV